ncbi:MAG: DUF4164 family protein [Alphaproteobacteria bacterium]
MAETMRLEAAAARLRTALASLETVVDQRLESDRSQSVLAIQLDAAHADRARLAEEMDQAADRIAMLETVNRDVARRLDQAMDAVRMILKTNGA